MADLIPLDNFRKMRVTKKIHDDPTYLSFFFMFDWYNSKESPLFAPNGAEYYLENVVKDLERVKYLKRFKAILKKLNKEMPWFWQSVSGLEITKQYNKMEDPFRGGSDSKIDINCLETVELTVTGLMDLYKKAMFDFDRWVEVVPANLRRFDMYIFVSEVRTFRTNTNVEGLANLIDSSGVLGENTNKTATGILNSNTPGDIRQNKPFFQIKLGHCMFDMDSTSAVFQDLNKSPDTPISPTISIRYEIIQDIKDQYANSMPTNMEDDDKTAGELLAQGAKDALIGGAINKVEGAIQNTLNNTIGKLLLGNVYGVNGASNIADAIRTGRINGIANSAGQIVGGGTREPDNSGMPDNIYPDPTQLKNAPIEPRNIYGKELETSSRGKDPSVSKIPKDLGNTIQRRV